MTMKKTPKQYMIELYMGILCVILLSFLISCTRKEEEKKIIGVCQANMIEAWQVAVKDDIQEEIAKYPECKLIFEDAGNNTQKQRIDIENMIKRDVDIIIVTECNGERPIANLTAARKAGIPVILLGSQETVPGYYDCRIFFDGNKIGYLAGQRAAELMNGKGKILELQGVPGLVFTEQLKKGFLKALESYPEMIKEYVVVGYGTADSASAAMANSELLKQQSGIRLIFAHNNEMAVSAKTAAEKEGLSVYVIGIDLMQDSIDDMAEGQKRQMDGYVYCHSGGREAVELAVRLLDGEEIPRTYELEPQLR